jgi:hypothetical protein
MLMKPTVYERDGDVRIVTGKRYLPDGKVVLTWHRPEMTREDALRYLGLTEADVAAIIANRKPDENAAPAKPSDRQR